MDFSQQQQHSEYMLPIGAADRFMPNGMQMLPNLLQQPQPQRQMLGAPQGMPGGMPFDEQAFMRFLQQQQMNSVQPPGIIGSNG